MVSKTLDTIVLPAGAYEGTHNRIISVIITYNVMYSSMHFKELYIDPAGADPGGSSGGSDEPPLGS